MAIGFTLFMHQQSHFKSTPRLHTIDRVVDVPALTSCLFIIVDSAEGEGRAAEEETEQ